jgi:DNA-binding transcriptional MerR regulator
VSSKAAVPDKLYFKIGEVASSLGVKPYVLRYWESEFNVIKPTKTRSKHRLYRQRDVDVLRRIKHLLYDERLTIEGARKRLKGRPPVPAARTKTRATDSKLRAALVRLKKDIESLHRMLS